MLSTVDCTVCGSIRSIRDSIVRGSILSSESSLVCGSILSTLDHIVYCNMTVCKHVITCTIHFDLTLYNRIKSIVYFGSLP